MTSSTTIILPLLTKAWIISIALPIGLFRYLMARLSIESIEMAHMDPTDIVLVPFDLNRLAIHVAATTILAGLFLKSFPKLVHWVQAALAYFVMAIVCGTPPTRDIYHTILACAYVATLTVLIPSTNTNNQTIPWWQAPLTWPTSITKASSASASFQQLLAMAQIHGTLFLTIPFAVLRLYDWGSQIQRWPLPIMLGSTFGFVLGTLLGTVGIGILTVSPTAQRLFEQWTLRSSSDGSNTISNKDK